jgi:hypothetical protein
MEKNSNWLIAKAPNPEPAGITMDSLEVKAP